jgi:hypothetical protein
MGLEAWCSPVGSKRAAAFGAGRRTRARDTALVFASKPARFRPRQRNKALAGVLDRLTDSEKEQRKVDPMAERQVAEKTSDYADQQQEV